ncbi:hypothetical protein PV682_31110 [Streptomyces niveiscabiei]|uniref:hypothetical protein n=1 Tax=Streptomyces niveiscabiei TaxID=164115 RepID=UPI0029BD5D6A|nr:hypothetical protein [Streptomyces niveiscabiei]MDX3385875.1 hypothetical protein [Streptomyces niveiscabiei]
MSRKTSTALAVLAATALIPVTLTGQADAAPRTAKERAAAAYAESWREHPGDYLALERAVTDAGGDSLRFDVPAVGLHGATAAQVQEAYDRAASTKDIPTDAFQVSGSWYHTQDQYGEWWTASGQWNFRDDYVNGSDPDDASGLAVDDVDFKCWQNDGSNLLAADWQNNPYDQMWRHTATKTENVWNIDDATQGFAMKADHGSHLLHFKRIGYGCDDSQKFSASYHYEHNQDGNGGWGVSITVLGMSLSYTGSGGDTMQKSTDIYYNNPAGS